MKGIFDNYSKFLVQKLFKSILRYKFTVKGKKKNKKNLDVVDEESDNSFGNELDDTQYMG